ncbi:MAG: glycosyltransferase family 47 protein [Parachlamydiales bacterium]|nr:glycosyltransferase family 47 protein [Parachlamydiales bacterium]
MFFVLSLTAHPLKVPTYRYQDFPNTNDHIGLYPFISALTYRNMCNHIINQSTEWFDPEKVNQGDFIYLNLWYLDWFVQEVHDRIHVPYILVSGDIGGWFPEPKHSKILYDPKLAAWFCRNMVFSHHPKLFQLPMGQDLTLFTYHRAAYDTLISAVVHKDSVEKKHLLYMCFLPRAHGDRDKIANMFLQEPYCYSINRPLENLDLWNQLYRPMSVFYNDLAASYFALSPLGLETDSVRTWEALVLGCIPIVEHTFLDSQYEGLPVVIVEDWKEINERFLRKKYEELKTLKVDKAYFDYWRDQMLGVQKKVQGGDLQFAAWDASRWKIEELNDLQEIVLKCPSLKYVGFLSMMRPLELAEALPWMQIDLYDYWLNRDLFDRLRPPPNLRFKPSPISEISTSCFLDLTYYRTSLYINFNTSVVEDGNFRHSLKRDLHRLMGQLQEGALLCGNCAEDPYVKKVLEAFEEEVQMDIAKKGSFWVITKERKKKPFQTLFPFTYPKDLLPHRPAAFAYQEPLENLIRRVGAKIVVAIGTSACDLAKFLPDEGLVFAAGPQCDHQFLSNVVHEHLTHKIIPIQMDPLAASRKFLHLNCPVDLVFLESCKEQDLQAWYSVIKDHGILCGGSWNTHEVRSAVTQFAKERNLFLTADGDFWMYFLGF